MRALLICLGLRYVDVDEISVHLLAAHFVVDEKSLSTDSHSGCRECRIL